MKGRVIRFEGSTHAQSDRLLPWWVNGTLADGDRAQVERHLAECATCRREAAWLRALQEEYPGDESVAFNAPRVMRRLRRRITTGASVMPIPPVSVWRQRGRRLAWLAAAEAVLILGLGAVAFRQQHATYHTLGAPSVRASVLVVAFDPRISEARLRQLLRAGDARIVDGPTAAGAYLLRVPDAHIDAARRMLRDSPEVTMVEGLEADGQP
ncbi:zf-HC2 domain-containing protein [Rhodanobacter sp. 7MK24]|uniref:zf-HC2 domain-containing protein n=1 Tax=Rhodanobacter sp. 7MK24 TaxID=2775922 RepID=UPI00177DAF26|nr:zf-HC2 domain-containing protein [Rhodanobacter sp. 7MK24]MBD8879979.1 zf-HC2 domain-containing protein [Rhodanobacter sp. 7MK24]